jgi:hypothetical protein
MLKKPITYTDLNGIVRTEDYYFRLTKLDVAKLQTSVKGGFDVHAQSIAAGADGKSIIEFFENFIKLSYGEKSEDGRRHMKSDEITRAFMESPAYDALFEELVTDAKAAAAFYNAVMPKDLDEFAAKLEANATANTTTNGN